MKGRRFHCSEADYLTDRGVPLSVAVMYATRYGPASIARMWGQGIPPAEANAGHIDPASLCRKETA